MPSFRPSKKKESRQRGESRSRAGSSTKTLSRCAERVYAAQRQPLAHPDERIVTQPFERGFQRRGPVELELAAALGQLDQPSG